MAADVRAPTFAPDVAVEILSPGDNPRDVEAKIDVYLCVGTELVLIVDPKKRTITAYDAEHITVLTTDDTLRHHALPQLELPLGPLFSTALDLPQ